MNAMVSATIVHQGKAVAKLRVHSMLFLIGISLSLSAYTQEAARECNLLWDLPHDQVAVFDVLDGSKGIKPTEFCLIACELEKGIGASNTREVPLRFLFRRFPSKCKVGTQWSAREVAFGEANYDGIPPLEFAGTYRLRSARTARLGEFLKFIGRDKRGEQLLEVAVVEGSFQVFKGRRQASKRLFDKNPTANLNVLIIARQTDGAILGARWQWTGNWTNYSRLDEPAVTRAETGQELILREPLTKLTSAALSGRVVQAIERGVSWLKKQEKQGKIADQAAYAGLTSTDIGATALTVLALIHSGVSLEDPVMQRGLQLLATSKKSQAYNVALELMIIELKLASPSIKDGILLREEELRRLIASRITPQDKQAALAAATWLIENQTSSGSWGYESTKTMPNLSSTQYALMGLKSAARMGIAISPSVWKRALRHVEGSATARGPVVKVRLGKEGKSVDKSVAPSGWQYISGSEEPAYAEITNTMTLAAISSIAICLSELLLAGDQAEIKSESVWSGIACIQERYCIRASKPEGSWWGPSMLYYYLFSLERVGIFLNFDTIDGHDWYCEGAALILSNQSEDGRWSGPHGTPIIDTAFALLFLKRAILPVETPGRIPSIDKHEGQEKR